MYEFSGRRKLLENPIIFPFHWLFLLFSGWWVLQLYGSIF
jgi:hypothetical protein